MDRKLQEDIECVSRLICEHKQHMNLNIHSQKDVRWSVQENTIMNSNKVQDLPISFKCMKINHCKSHSMEKKVDISKDFLPAPSLPLDNTKQSCVMNSKVFSAAVNSGRSADCFTKNAKNQGILPEVDNSVTKIHINPHYFSKKNDDISSVTCKKVHINPRILAIQNNPPGFQDNNINQEPTGILTKKTDHYDARDPCNNNNNNPPSKHLNETKYVYHSKTKLIKVPIINQNNVCRVTLDNKMMHHPEPNRHNYYSGAKSIKTPNGGTLMALSRTKLVRIPTKSRRQSVEKIQTSPLCTSTPFSTPSKLGTKLKKSLFTSSSIKVAKKICSKYRSSNSFLPCNASSKYQINKTLSKIPKQLSSLKTQYQLDRRTLRSPKIVTRRKYNTNARLLQPNQNKVLFFPIHHLFKNRKWSKPEFHSQKIMISRKRLSRIGSNARTQHKQDSALVRIGDVLYKTSRTKLVLSKRCKEETTTVVPKPRTVVKRRKLNSGHTLYIYGNKFIMDDTGKTLQRVIDNSSNANSTVNTSKSRRSSLSRVDIGGVTYVQKTPNVLIRTNTHTARNVVSNAKNKSIAVLTRKMRKNNEHCLFYRRFGKCPRLEKGRCELVHDAKYIDICKKFLQGKCEKNGCLLSHDLIPEKMPTCRFFLEGCCVRDNCPYLHVKVNDKAPICRNFLLGYCAAGDLCSARHMLLCPDFDKKGVCRKGKFCRFPHLICPKIQKNLIDRINEPEEPKLSEQKTTEPPKRKRYYESESFLEEIKIASTQAHSNEFNLKSESHSDNEISEKRPKIGDLPSFISLESQEHN